MKDLIPYIILAIVVLVNDWSRRRERSDIEAGFRVERDRLLNRIQDPEAAVWQSISEKTPDQDKTLGAVDLTQAEDGQMHLVGQVIQGDFKPKKDNDSA